MYLVFKKSPNEKLRMLIDVENIRRSDLLLIVMLKVNKIEIVVVYPTTYNISKVTLTPD